MTDWKVESTRTMVRNGAIVSVDSVEASPTGGKQKHARHLASLEPEKFRKKVMVSRFEDTLPSHG